MPYQRREEKHFGGFRRKVFNIFFNVCSSVSFIQQQGCRDILKNAPKMINKYYVINLTCVLLASGSWLSKRGIFDPKALSRITQQRNKIITRVGDFISDALDLILGPLQRYFLILFHFGSSMSSLDFMLFCVDHNLYFSEKLFLENK